jgi:hypothetical protein
VASLVLAFDWLLQAFDGQPRARKSSISASNALSRETT